MRVTVLGSRRLMSLLGAAAHRPHSPTQVVQRREVPYWQETGWTRQSDVYYGAYHTKFGVFAGMIEERWDNFRFYMLDPPPEVRSCSHWACFQPRGKKGFLVHMGYRPGDASSGIITIERLITDAFERHG